MEGWRCDAGRERLRAPALQRFRERGMHPPGVQGEAAVPVHAPALAEDGRVAARSRPRARALFAAERPLVILSSPAKVGDPIIPEAGVFGTMDPRFRGDDSG